MAGRSTRNKVRWHVERATACQDKAIEHLQKADELANNKSPLINEKMPALVTLITAVKDSLVKFRNAL